MSAAKLLPKTIRGEFALFALSLALPLVALIGYGLYDRTRDDIAASEAIARRLAESNADRAAEYVAGLRGALEAVARRPLVRAMDAARCDPRLADLVDLYPRVSSFIVVDREGVILCSSAPLPRDRVLRIVDEELLREMLADPRFRVSKPVLSRVTGRWIVSAVQPVLGEDGALLGTVAVATDLLRWQPFVTPEALPERAILTVVTLDGTIIARSVEAEKWIGRKLWDERLLTRIAERKEGVVHAAGTDNVERVFGVSQVAALPWFVLAGLPEESVLAPARERLLETGALLLLIVFLVMALAWGLVARLSKPIRAIAEAVAARTKGGGEAKIPVAGPIEVAEVAEVLNRLIEERSRTERMLRDLSELSSDFSWETDAQHRFTRAAHGKRLGLVFAPGSEIGTARWELPSVAPDEAGWRVYRETVDARREFRDFRFARRDPQGNVRHFEVSGKPLYENDRFVGYRGTGVEVTLRVHAEEQLERLNRELEDRVRVRTAELVAANKELESFSYSVSHDLRAPLRAIDGYALMLDEDYGGRLDDEGRRLLGVVRESSAQMARLIDDLLRFSQVGRKPLARSPLDMGALAREVVAELSAAYPKTRIALESLPAAAGDRALLRQVWANLIGNALKYSGRQESPRVEVGGRVDGAQSLYWVRDNGAGFDMRYYERLFKVFQRLHGEDEFEGTGVGLAIVQRVVARHGGRVWGEAALGKGACFHFALPKED